MILIVNIRVSKERIGDFIAATRENMGHSRAEPGISRFEFLQDDADPNRFVLFEGYRDAAALASHKETAHYLKWKDLVDPMMAEPRSRASYSEIVS
jgi:(4S)-4-hydroxy-5-phosphonooxypentane-2,3-dione isomerase